MNWTDLAHAVAGAARQQPSFALYLTALALFPVKWFSPFSYPQAGWIDLLFAAAAVVWVVEKLRARSRVALRVPIYAYAAYLTAVFLSAVFVAADQALAFRNVVIAAELVAVAVLTADYARDPARRAAIAQMVLIVVFILGVEAAIAMALFYSGVSSSLLGTYGIDLVPSSSYARVAGGFYSAPLLGSFCIFASAILALPETGISRSARRIAQAILALVVVLTISRAVIGFVLAAVIRWAHTKSSPSARRLATACAMASVIAMLGLTFADVQLNPTKPSSSTYQLFKASSNPRLQGLETSFHTALGHPVLGLGPGSLPGEYEMTPFRAHCTPVNVAATVGLPALAAVGYLVAGLWRQRRRPTNVAIWSGLAGLGIDALGQDVEHFRQVWIMLGLADADRAGEQDPDHS